MPNKLINEKSPYLLQHANNPVHWYPWGEEAFKRAKDEDKPIFLSIGYSTCYWCHVMEREVFENKHIAEEMNKMFINIKVDREERPDVDRVYMSALQDGLRRLADVDVSNKRFKALLRRNIRPADVKIRNARL
jgi:uncharacterized protein